MAYYLESDDRELLRKLRKTNVCAECGGVLEAVLDMKRDLPYLQCKAHPEHEGIAKQYREPRKLTIIARREQMVKEYGSLKTKALDRYIAPGSVMTRAIATEIVETLWGEAPAIEKLKAIMICHQYNLNPLMKHLHMVGYRKRDSQGDFVKDGAGNYVLDWTIMQGIGATRLMSHRKHNFTYMDMTPRKATQGEVDKILGDTANAKQVYAFTHIKDLDTGAEAYGLRGCLKEEKVKGAEKGNTPLNMACVRSERLAIDRLYPGEMPEGIEAFDESFVELPEVSLVDKITGEIIEGGPSDEPPPEGPPPESHLDVLTTREEKPPEDVGAKPPQPKRDPATVKTLSGLMKACFDDFGMQPKAVYAELNVKSSMEITESASECYQRIAAVRVGV